MFLATLARLITPFLCKDFLLSVSGMLHYTLFFFLFPLPGLLMMGVLTPKGIKSSPMVLYHLEVENSQTHFSSQLLCHPPELHIQLPTPHLQGFI